MATRLLLLLAVVSSLLASLPAYAQDDVPLDPVGRHFLRNMTPGMVTFTVGAGAHALPMLGVFAQSEIGDAITAAFGPAAAGVTLLGGVFWAIPMHRAAIDLRLRGVRMSLAAGWVGHTMLAVGTGIMVAGLVDYWFAWGETRPVVWAYVLGTGISLFSVVPYAMQTGAIRRAYWRVGPAPSGTGLRIAPYADPIGRTIGVTGRF